MTRISIPTRRQLFIPLPVAAAILYRAFLRERSELAQDEDELERHIDEAAHSLALAIRIYRMDLADPVELARATLGEGRFVEGARKLRFDDGRPALDHLAVNKGELEASLSRRAHIVPERRPETIIPSKFLRPKL